MQFVKPRVNYLKLRFNNLTTEFITRHKNNNLTTKAKLTSKMFEKRKSKQSTTRLKQDHYQKQTKHTKAKHNKECIQSTKINK